MYDAVKCRNDLVTMEYHNLNAELNDWNVSDRKMRRDEVTHVFEWNEVENWNKMVSNIICILQIS